MISKEDKYYLKILAEKYKVSKLYLFGSSIDISKESNDIDIAVEGLPDSLFFKFYGELIFSLSKPVDLIDLSKESLMNSLIKSNGILVYG